MNILIIHNSYRTTHVGGEDIVFQNEVSQLKKHLGPEHVFTYEVSNDHLNKFKLLFEIWFSNSHYKKVIQLIQYKNIDLVHVHNFFPQLTPSVLKAAKDGGKKVVLTMHNYRPWCISGNFFRNDIGICEVCTQKKFSWAGIKNRCYRNSFFMSLLSQLAVWFYHSLNYFSWVDLFLSMSPSQHKKLISLGLPENKMVTKANAVRFTPSSPDNKSGYIYVGRLEVAKGVDLLLEEWSKLGPEFKLTLVGQINERPDLLKYASPNIIFKGKLGHEETLKLISESKFLIQPSLQYETFGMTILEAMAQGTPVIGFNIGTRKDFIENEINGFIGKENEFISMIKKSFSYSEYVTMSAQALKSSQKYSNELVTHEQIKIYQKLLEKP